MSVLGSDWVSNATMASLKYATSHLSCPDDKLDLYKVEKILKGSLDSIPSPLPLVKIQTMGGKVSLNCKGKTFLGIVNKLLKTK